VLPIIALLVPTEKTTTHTHTSSDDESLRTCRPDRDPLLVSSPSPPPLPAVLARAPLRAPLAAAPLAPLPLLLLPPSPPPLWSSRVTRLERAVAEATLLLDSARAQPEGLGLTRASLAARARTAESTASEVGLTNRQRYLGGHAAAAAVAAAASAVATTSVGDKGIAPEANAAAVGVVVAAAAAAAAARAFAMNEGGGSLGSTARSATQGKASNRRCTSATPKPNHCAGVKPKDAKAERRPNTRGSSHARASFCAVNDDAVVLDDVFLGSSFDTLPVPLPASGAASSLAPSLAALAGAAA